jgi:cytochrome c1
MRAPMIRACLAAAALGSSLGLATAGSAWAAGEEPDVPSLSWSFEGPFGRYDDAQLQRGFRVHREVCANCHSMSLLSFRNLAQPGGPGFTEAQAKQIASEYKVQDGPNDQGEMFERPGRLSDRFPKPFPNEQAARAANGGALPPDLSVMAKARAAGTDYLHALLVGYRDPPPGVEVPAGQYYNAYFPGHLISMPPPLSDGQVEYTDGTPATVDQYAKDVSAFLMWAAEPKLEERKRLGFHVMSFLAIFTGLLYLTKRKIWSGLDH